MSTDLTIGLDVDVALEIPTGNPAMPTISQNVPIHYELDVFRYSTGFYGQYNWNRIKLTGEYRTIDMTQEVDGEELSKSTSEYYYGQIDIQVLDKLAFATYYDVTYPDVDDKEGQSRSSNKFLSWQKDLDVSLRYDITTNWLAKVDVHFMNGLTSIVGTSDVQNPQEDWMMFVFKNTFFF
jgi:hypothetical protein